MVPWLATAWKQSDDGLTYTFTLKDGVKFTDGTPVDAEAVAWNFDLWENHAGNSTATASFLPMPWLLNNDAVLPMFRFNSPNDTRSAARSTSPSGT